MWIEALRRTPSSPPSSSVGLEGGDRAARRRLAPGRLDVVDREGDVVDAVAVRADVLGDLAVGRQRRGEHEPDVVLDHDVAGPVADLGLETAEGDRGEAPQRAVVGRGLAGVADPELDVVDALERQEVGGLGVGVRVDPGAGLVGGALRDRSASSRSPLLAAVRSVATGAPAGGRCLHATPARATLAPMDDQQRRRDTSDFDSRLAGVAQRLSVFVRRSRLRPRGRLPSGSIMRPRPRGGRARCSPTSRRCSRSGSARPSASST